MEPNSDPNLDQNTQVGVPENDANSETQKRETFLTQIRDSLTSIIDANELKKQSTVRKYGGHLEIAEVFIPDTLDMSKALYLLEKKGLTVSMVGEFLVVAKHAMQLEAIPHHKNILKDLEICQKWFSQVNKYFEHEKLDAHIVNHPVQIVRSIYEEEVCIKAENHYTARLALQFFEGNKIRAKKRGKMVYATISSDILKINLENIILLRESLKKADEDDTFVVETKDYGLFHFLPFNRDRDPKHIEWIAKSMDQFGVVDVIKVAYTDCVDGEWKMWIVDGQHTYSACMKRGLRIKYITIHVDSLEELVRLTAVLNNRRKLWKFGDYLKAWAELNVPVYRKIAEWISKKLPSSVIIEALSGKNRGIAKVLFQDGSFEEDFSLNSDEILNNMLVLRPHLPKSSTVSSAVLRFMWNEQNYDNKRMESVLKKSRERGGIIFEVGETANDVFKNLKKMYDREVVS